jgi:hypothetical protein
MPWAACRHCPYIAQGSEGPVRSVVAGYSLYHDRWTRAQPSIIGNGGAWAGVVGVCIARQQTARNTGAGSMSEWCLLCSTGMKAVLTTSSNTELLWYRGQAAREGPVRSVSARLLTGMVRAMHHLSQIQAVPRQWGETQQDWQAGLG